mgnify:CR=1 FL=1
MPSDQIAEYIPRSLAEDENRADFEHMLDTLVRLRRPYHPNAEPSLVERVAGKIVCVLVTPKPPRYVSAMKEYRSLFRGVASVPSLKATYANSILPAALTAETEEDIEFQPSLYFSPVPVLQLAPTFPRLRLVDPRALRAALARTLPSWF